MGHDALPLEDVIPGIGDALHDVKIVSSASTPGSPTLPAQDLQKHGADGSDAASGKSARHQLDDLACTGLGAEPSLAELQQKSLMDLPELRTITFRPGEIG